MTTEFIRLLTPGLLFLAATALADPFAGAFEARADGDLYRLLLTAGPDGTYTGRLDVDGESIPVRARRQGQTLAGEFVEDDEPYRFVARVLDGGAILFEDEFGDTVSFAPAGSAAIPGHAVSRDTDAGDGFGHAPRVPPPPGHAAPAPAAGQAPSPPVHIPYADQAPNAAPALRDSGAVMVNGQPLSADTVARLQAAGIGVTAGHFWYDAQSGAWGFAGGPTLGFIQAGLALGGSLSPDASGGTTGVFVNGRQLPVQDLVALQSLTGPLQPARYFIDAFGNAGYEGGPPLLNLRAVAAHGGGNWRSSVTGASGGYDGSGSGFVILRDPNGRPTTVGY